MTVVYNNNPYCSHSRYHQAMVNHSWFCVFLVIVAALVILWVIVLSTIRRFDYSKSRIAGKLHESRLWSSISTKVCYVEDFQSLRLYSPAVYMNDTCFDSPIWVASIEGSMRVEMQDAFDIRYLFDRFIVIGVYDGHGHTNHILQRLCDPLTGLIPRLFCDHSRCVDIFSDNCNIWIDRAFIEMDAHVYTELKKEYMTRGKVHMDVAPNLASGSTATIVAIDLETSRLRCLNIGDSEAVVYSTDDHGTAAVYGKTNYLTRKHGASECHDAAAESKDAASSVTSPMSTSDRLWYATEYERIRTNGGELFYLSNDWRVNGCLNMTRAFGNYPTCKALPRMEHENKDDDENKRNGLCEPYFLDTTRTVHFEDGPVCTKPHISECIMWSDLSNPSLLVATDGLWNSPTARAFTKTLLHTRTKRKCTDEAIEYYSFIMNASTQSSDNTTAVYIRDLTGLRKLWLSSKSSRSFISHIRPHICSDMDQLYRKTSITLKSHMMNRRLNSSD